MYNGFRVCHGTSSTCLVCSLSLDLSLAVITVGFNLTQQFDEPLLTHATAANQMAQQMGMANPAAMINPMQPGQDPDKLYLSEAENLEVMEHFCILDGVEERVLRNFALQIN